MPRKEMNYSNSCVYKICCNDINIKDLYVGSTATKLNVRRREHKSACNNKNSKSYNLNVYKFIRDNGGWDNWTVILVESYPNCKSRKELHKFERYHMEILESTLNSIIPSRTKKESREDNKEHYKEYRKNNSEKIKEYSKEYYRNNIEKIKEKKKEYDKQYKKDNIEKIKEYRKNNSEKKKEYGKEYYRNNIEKIKEKNKEKIECEFCKSIVQKCGISHHHKSKKCLAQDN